jgi:hypothetical protein
MDPRIMMGMPQMMAPQMGRAQIGHPPPQGNIDQLMGILGAMQGQGSSHPMQPGPGSYHQKSTPGMPQSIYDALVQAQQGIGFLEGRPGGIGRSQLYPNIGGWDRPKGT